MESSQIENTVGYVLTVDLKEVSCGMGYNLKYSGSSH